MILDTSAIIDFFRGNAAIRTKLQALEEDGTVFSTTVISVVEMFRGIDVSNREKVKELDEYFGGVELLALTPESAREAGIISSMLRGTGLLIEPEDCMIAGIAKTKGEPILTRNTKHFERIRGLKIETY